MILLINNDKRMNYLAEYIRQSGLDLMEYRSEAKGFDLNALKEVDYFILPFGGLAADGRIAATDLYFTEEVMEVLKKECTILSPIKYPRLMELLKKRPLKFDCIFDYDEVAIYNSIPTAEGVIFNIIKNTEITIHQSNILVVGAGRCGITLARDLKALGANVVVTYRKKADESRLFELGLEPLFMEDYLKELPKFDVIINSVPAMVLDKEALDLLQAECYILDIASKPGGTDFEYAKSLGLNAELAGALPSIVAPKTAAYYLFRFIDHYIGKDKKGKSQ